MFEELFGNMLGEKVCRSTARKAFVDGVAWIVLLQVKGDVYLAVRSGSKYPAPAEVVKIPGDKFVQ